MRSRREAGALTSSACLFSEQTHVWVLAIYGRRWPEEVSTMRLIDAFDIHFPVDAAAAGNQAHSTRERPLSKRSPQIWRAALAIPAVLGGLGYWVYSNLEWKDHRPGPRQRAGAAPTSRLRQSG